MIRKYHNHKPQTNPWHHEEGPHNNHETLGRQTKQNNQFGQNSSTGSAVDVRTWLTFTVFIG